MNSKLSRHLNDDEFTDCLIGAEPGGEAAAHLRECEACREELARFGMSVDSFNMASQAWSEARPAMSVRAREARGVGRPFFAVASYALAACLMLGVAVEAVLHHEQSGAPATVASVSGPQEDSAAQIAQDNKLLMDVDMAIRSDDRSLVQQYGLGPAANGRTRAKGAVKN